MDQRKIANQKVKDSLLEALIELSRDREWSNLTVTELIERAGVARASFYRNFSSIEAIIDYGIMKMIEVYNAEKPTHDETFRNKELILFKFRFYQKYADLVLTFHRAQAPKSLLSVIDDFVMDAYGDMPSSSITRYELFYYSGAFYNMVIHWLESGSKESPEEMADAFIRIANM